MKCVLICLSVYTLCLTGCATENGVRAVNDRANFDLNCPRKDIKYRQIGQGSFVAKGCGKFATYTTNRCWSGDLERCKATLERVAEDKTSSQE